MRGKMTESDELERIAREVYIPWCPLPGFEKTDLANFYDDQVLIKDDCLTLVFDDNATGRKLTLRFVSPLAFRYADEGRRFRTFITASFEGALPFRVVENSVWLQWFHEESDSVFENDPVVHYCIVTRNYIFDVLTLFEPEAEMTPCPDILSAE